jgi:hypothetical protein
MLPLHAIFFAGLNFHAPPPPHPGVNGFKKRHSIFEEHAAALKQEVRLKRVLPWITYEIQGGTPSSRLHIRIYQRN